MVLPHEKTDLTPTLSGLGISKSESSRLQRLAKVDDSSFETAVAQLKEQAIAGRQFVLSTAGVIRVTREEGRTEKEPEFSPLIKPSDNWNFGSIKYGRIDDGLGEDWGYIPGELYANCFWYYENPGDLVVAFLSNLARTIGDI